MMTSPKTFAVGPFLFALLVASQICATSSFSIFSSSVPEHLHNFPFFKPSVRSIEDAKAYKFFTTVPGVSASGVKLNVTDDGFMKLVATSTSGQEVLRKTLKLSDDADVTSVRSWCTDGILEIAVDKLETPEPVDIEVKPSDPPSLSENDTTYVVRKSVPGLSASEVLVTIEADIKTGSDILSIKASSNHGYGEYAYSFNLPDDADKGAIAAFCSNGLIHVHIPKTEPVPPVKIPVSSSDLDLVSNTSDVIEVVQLRVPGYTAAEVEIEASEEFLRVQFNNTGRVFERYAALPRDLEDVTKLSAVCTNGVLQVTFPKLALRQHEELEIEVSAERPELPQDDSDDPTTPQRAQPVRFQSLKNEIERQFEPLSLRKEVRKVMNANPLFW